MATYSTNLALTLLTTGEGAGTWGNTTNTNLGTLLEQAISGYVTQAVATGTDTTLTIPNGATGVARNMFIELTGTGGTNTNLIVPANKKLYFIYNNSTGAVTVKVTGQTGVSVAAASKVILVSNGTDIVQATSYLTTTPSSLSLTTLTATSATITTLTSTSAGITTLTGTSMNVTTATHASANITTLAGTTATYTSATISNLGSTSANITTLTGTTATYTSATISNLGSTSANITTLTGTTATYTSATISNLGSTSANITTLTGTTATYGSANITTIAGTTATYGSANITTLTGTTVTYSGSGRVNSLGVGAAATGTAGEIVATNNITAYYSDARLKNFQGPIPDALHKVKSLGGYLYIENEVAKSFGFNNPDQQVGVSAQEVAAVLPHVIALAPFDMAEGGQSASGQNYMTVRYERLVPLLIEAIKELSAKVEALEGKK
jgi:hypothetical protein